MLASGLQKLLKIKEFIIQIFHHKISSSFSFFALIGFGLYYVGLSALYRVLR